MIFLCFIKNYMAHRDLKLVDWILIEFKGQEITKENIGVFNFPRKQFKNIFLVSDLVDFFFFYSTTD